MKEVSKSLLRGTALWAMAAATMAAAQTAPADVPVEEARAAAKAACDGARTYRIAYSHSVSEAALVKTVRVMADRRAKELGCVTLLLDNTQANNLEQQITAVQGWIPLGVDAIVVTPIDEAALKPFQKQAQVQGVKWLTYLSPMSGNDGHVGFDHKVSGSLVAQAAVDWVKANNVETPEALITTLTSLPSFSPRWTEVERIFGEAGIAVMATQDSADQATGMAITETVLQQHPGLDIVIGLNDDAAVGAYRAVKVSGKDETGFFIGGQDGSMEGLAAIDQGGAYRASSAILINDLGANIVDLSRNAITGNGPSFVDTPTVLATKADQALLDKLRANYAE